MQHRQFIGRNEQLKHLQNLAQTKAASFVVIKGRRRIGKSRLVAQFSESFQQYYKFEGLPPQKNTTAQSQLKTFCQQLSRQFAIPEANYNSWADALWALADRVKKGKILVFFDEISWMGSESHDFLGQIKYVWDNHLQKNPKLMFITCGSASAWIEKNLLSSTGFVGRISYTLTLKELTLQESYQFWPAKFSGHIASFEKLKFLSVVGGVPRYLEEMDPTFSAEENIKRLCFMQGGLLVNEFSQIFSDLFLRDSQFYRKIIEILAAGACDQATIQHKLDGTAKGTHRVAKGRLSEYLWELEESGFISRDYTWSINTGLDSKLSRYRLKDNYLRFYVKYIQKYLTQINRGSFQVKSLFSLPGWQSIMGLQFENLVLNNRQAIQQQLQLQPDDIINENPFFQRKTLRTPGCQIDYLIQTRFNTLYVCEIKFSRNVIGSEVISDVQEKIAHLKYPKSFSCRPVLIHVNGISEELLEDNYFAAIINFAELGH